jgi:predicted nuclease of restriction endonuclease-like (RecB) superfamily
MLEQNIINYQEDFAQVYSMIAEAQSKVWQQVNMTLIQLYWNIGRYVSEKIKREGWGKSVVDNMSNYITTKNPSIKGFSSRNIRRMSQFFETYQDHKKLSALLTEISWSNHLHILSKTKSIEEKQFYLELASEHRYSERDFARVIDSCTYERAKLANLKWSALLTELPAGNGQFKDSYIFEFLNLPDDHKEHDLRRALILHMR